MYKVIGIAVAVVVFVALVIWALMKKGWLIVTKVADSKKYSVAWEGPKVKVSKKTEAEVAA